MAEPPPAYLGIVCSPQDYARSITDKSIRCLTRGESIGLTCVASAGLLSLSAVLYVFLIILRNVAWRFRNVARDRLHVFHRPMDLLMFSLFTADVLQAIGAVMDIKWIHDGKSEVSHFCNAQGIIQQLGETGVAMTTLMIAVYTFLGIWLGKDLHSMFVTRLVVGGTWTFIVFMVILGNLINRGSGVHYEAPTPYWCWISEGYLEWRIWGEYIWFWITLTVSCAVYIPLYLWSRGNIEIDDHVWWKFSFRNADKNADPALWVVRRRALGMLAYPLVYCTSILPLSVVRWITFVHPNAVSGTATFVVVSIFGLSGACNVVLLLSTRPESVLFGKPMNFSTGRAPSVIAPYEDYPMENRTEAEEGSAENDLGLGRLPSR